MTKEDYFKKAIMKASKNGYKNPFIEHPEFDELIYGSLPILYFILFSHDFAKALGYKLQDLGEWCDNDKDPLKYLEQFIK